MGLTTLARSYAAPPHPVLLRAGAQRNWAESRRLSARGVVGEVGA